MTATPPRWKKAPTIEAALSRRLNGMTALAAGLVALAAGPAFGQTQPPTPAPATTPAKPAVQAKPAAPAKPVTEAKPAAKPAPAPTPVAAPAAPAAPTFDEQPLWTLYNDHRYDDLQARIAQMEAETPGWHPSTALADALLGVELREQITNAKSWRAANQLRARYPDQFDCNHIDNVWALADAGLKANQRAAALTLYRGILAKCTDEHARILTIERFGPAGAYDEAYQLLGEETAKVSDQKDLDALAAAVTTLDIRHLSALVAAGDFAAAKGLAPRLEPLIVATRNLDGVNALGAMEMKQNHVQAAIPWLIKAAAWNPGPDTGSVLAIAYLKEGDLPSAAALAAEYPNSPLFVPIRRAVALQEAQAAYRAGKYDAVITIVDTADKQGAGSVELSLARAWSLYELGRPDAADGFAQIATAHADTPGVADQAATGLLYALLMQCPGGGKLVPAKPIDLTDPTSGLPPIPTDNAIAGGDCLNQEIDRRSRAEIEAVLSAFQGRLTGASPDDPKAALAFGWYYARLGSLDDALKWFDRARQWTQDPEVAAQAKTGSAEVLLQAKRYEELRTLLAGDQADPVLRPLYAEALRGLAHQANAEHRYAESNSLLRQAITLTPARREDVVTMAWNDYGLHDTKSSGASFSTLYAARPDRDVAQGLVLSAEANDDLHTLDHLSGPVHPLLMDAYGDQALQRRQYIRALHFDPPRYPQLAGIDLPVTSVDVVYRDKSGTSGQGKLYGPTVYLAQTMIVGTDEWRFGLALSDWSSGHPGTQSIASLPTSAATRSSLAADCGAGASISTIGSLGCPAFSPIDSTGLLVEPKLSWSRKTEKIEYLASIGTTPLGGIVSPTIAAHFEAAWVQENGGRLEASIDRSINRESILAFSGQRDPATGSSWGRVVENSINAKVFEPLGRNWFLHAGLELGELDGVHVHSNDKLAFSVSVAKNIADRVDPAQLAILTLGPEYAFEAFQRNLDGFDLGQGGYFSPQSFHRLGLSGYFETQPIGRLVARGGGFLGWQKANENNAVAFIYAPTGESIIQPGRRASNLGGDIYWDLSYLILPWMMLDAGFSYDKMPTYDEWRTLIGLQIPFGGTRASVTIDDVPDIMSDQR
jgi:tetratricopeptide (TPR) repeat protein